MEKCVYQSWLIGGTQINDNISTSTMDHFSEKSAGEEQGIFEIGNRADSELCRTLGGMSCGRTGPGNITFNVNG